MTMVITSYTPETGTAAGGTEVTVTGTGLSTVVSVLVGSHEAEIIGTPSATTVVFRTPPGSGSKKVALFDGTTVVEATDNFVYTAVPAGDELLVTQLAGRFRADVSEDGGTTWVHVRGCTTLKPGVNYGSEDDSDMDSGSWGSTLITGLNWVMTFTCKRGRGKVSGAYDPGQEIIRAAHDKLGSAGIVLVRWYDRSATSVNDEAYQGYANVQWSPQGGNKTGDKVDVTLSGQGERTVINNPVIADPTLAGEFAAA